MAGFARRLAIGLMLAYATTIAGLYLAQDWLIFPAPQQQHQPAPGFAAVTLETSDQLKLTAHWRAPAPGRSAVVFFHGNAGSLAGAAAETTLFAASGYGVLLVEYRGYGGNPGIPSEAGFTRDGRAAMAFLAAQGITPARTIVVGNSIGSGTATEMARAFNPAALILTSPFTSLPDVAAQKMPAVPVHLLLNHQFDNQAKITSLTMPVLVIHGTTDQVVPFTHGKTLAAAAPNATFRAVAGAGHELSFLPAAQTLQTDWLAGLDL